MPGVSVNRDPAAGWGISTTVPTSTKSYGSPNTFTAAVNTQASDYDAIMKQYQDMVSNFNSNPLFAGTVQTSSVAPQISQYKQSDDVNKSLSNLKDLANTGGYSAADKQNILARDISPIRSIYANDEEEVQRQKALSGGYSPNFNSVMSQMARDEANKISDVNTKANADIAQNVATNRIAAASPYASASSSANAAQTAADQKNADIINQINEDNINRNTQVGEFNAATSLDAAKTNRSNTLGAIGGQASLYGTTPALVNTFGNQVVQANQLGQSQQDLNNRRFVSLASAGGH